MENGKKNKFNFVSFIENLPYLDDTWEHFSWMPSRWLSCLAGEGIVPWCRGWSTFLQTSSHWGWRTLEGLDETWPHSALLLFTVEQTQAGKNYKLNKFTPIRRWESQCISRSFSTNSKNDLQNKDYYIQNTMIQWWPILPFSPPTDCTHS